MVLSHYRIARTDLSRCCIRTLNLLPSRVYAYEVLLIGQVMLSLSASINPLLSLIMLGTHPPL